MRRACRSALAGWPEARQHGPVRRDAPAPNAPSGYLLPDLADLVLEFGASYPLLGYFVSPDEAFDEPTALDPVIYAGLLHP